jgi:uncharacterized protein (DUF433 family)
MSVNDIVEVDPEKMSGTPVFRGTRVPIQNLFDSLEAGETVDEFLDQYPTVTREQVPQRTSANYQGYNPEVESL